MKGYEDRPAPKCPDCGETVDDALEAKDFAEMEEATPSKRLQLLGAHMKSHAGGLRGWRPNFPMDHKWRSRGLLHRRMNVVSNCIAATFLRVLFDEKKRLSANALLELHKMLWRFPEKSGKRAKTISAGNDARRFVTDPELLAGLIEIFWGEESRAAAKAELEKLAAAATANEACRTDDSAAAGVAATKKRRAAQAPTAAKPAARSRKSPLPVAAGGVAKKARQKPKQVVGQVLTSGAKAVTGHDVQAYKRKRASVAGGAGAGEGAGAGAAAAGVAGAEDAATTGGAGTGASAAGAPAEGSSPPVAGADEATPVRRSPRVAEMPAHDAPDHELVDDDDESCEIGGTFMEGDEDGDLEEDEQVGGLLTAIDVWLTAIKYLTDIHTELKDHYDMVERKAHADKCAASGKAWALTINEHTSNKSVWQYVHDAFAHIHEDIMVHGSGDRNDDAILEKGNRFEGTAIEQRNQPNLRLHTHREMRASLCIHRGESLADLFSAGERSVSATASSSVGARTAPAGRATTASRRKWTASGPATTSRGRQRCTCTGSARRRRCRDSTCARSCARPSASRSRASSAPLKWRGGQSRRWHARLAVRTRWGSSRRRR